MLEDGFLPATSRHTLWLLCGHGTAKAICSHRGDDASDVHRTLGHTIGPRACRRS